MGLEVTDLRPLFVDETAFQAFLDRLESTVVEMGAGMGLLMRDGEVIAGLVHPEAVDAYQLGRLMEEIVSRPEVVPRLLDQITRSGAD